MSLGGVLKQSRAAAALHDGGRIIKALSNNKYTTITLVGDDFPGSKPYTVAFSNLFLRDSSRSSKSVDPITDRKLITTGQLSRNPLATSPVNVRVAPGGKFVSISWEDGDSYDYPLGFLYKDEGSSSLEHESMKIRSSYPKTVLWDKYILNENMNEIMGTDYGAYMNDDKRLYQLLKTLSNYP